MNRMTTSIMDVPFSKLTLEETLAQLAGLMEEDRTAPYHLITANPEIVMKHREDAELQKIIREADHITPDGIGIVLASRWQKEPLQERVTGYDLLLGLLEEGNRRGWSFYLLGTDESTNKLAAERIKQQYEHVRIAGRHHGFFNREEEASILEQIEAVQPDVLVVALGAPGAEKWIYRNKQRLRAKLAFGVGGSLDIIGGKVKRSPVIWQQLNLEWLHRLLTQPARWRRQLILPVFAYKVLLGGGRKH